MAHVVTRVVVMRACVSGMRYLILLAALLGLAACQSGEDPRLTESREIAGAFAQQLGGQLKAALTAGGPLNAIGVCSELAPAIAVQQSASSGAAVSRTALRIRNPDNAPDDDARIVLEDFRQQVSAGAAMPVERFAAAPDGSARYMQAIVLQPMCAMCHGDSLAPEVRAAIQANYPDDQAIGFAVAELRGAFLIDWPAKE